GAPADDFVARFVGSSRGLRRLAVTPITRDDLIAPDGRSARLTIPLGASLEEALAMLMRNDDALVGVTENDSLVGALTPDAVHRALRRSVAEAPGGDAAPVGG
ncbi:MAG TPA: hypothetical protein VFJ19_10125, partial [Nocardioidaceae bacterium]|nr:hypothetical protein [Nocardioidaceae bacterium]